MGRSRFKSRELNGFTLRSGFEYQVGLILNELEIPWTYETYSYEYRTTVVGGTCPGCGSNRVEQQRFYTPDFFLWGDRIILEVKGRFTGTNRTTLRNLRQWQPSLDLRLVFQANNVYSKSSVKRDEEGRRIKRRYKDWATQFGYTAYTGLKQFREAMRDDKTRGTPIP